MSHSLYCYLKRRTTEELKNILHLCVDDVESAINREVVRLTVNILLERNPNTLVQLPVELLERLAYFM